MKLMIAVKNGFNVSPVIKELEQFQISAKSDVTDVIRQTNEKNISRLETGAMILICAIFMMQMSERCLLYTSMMRTGVKRTKRNLWR